ncbi:MAG: hypothetical protein JXN62_04115, partial [Bacteroidales bacterium]|nr:hypothetical protein [Bacteroidales bacterium]
MKKFVSLVSVLYILVSASGQQGSPLLTHYTESRDIENQNWAICQDEYEVMLFANRKGILTFDGEDWSLIRIPTVPYSIRKNPVDGKIYIGGYNNFGYLEKDHTGSYTYLSLSGNLIGIGVISKIICRDSLVWFYGENTIIRFNTDENIFDFKLDARQGFPYTGVIVTPRNTFVNVSERGLYRIDKDTLFPIVTGYLTINDDILFSLPYNENMVLVGFGGGKLSLFDGVKYYDFKIKDDEYLKENILSDGIALGDTAYAFSTLEGGAIVVGKTSREVLFIINNQNELPDDEVFAVGSDKTGGLWISHQYGLTRADLNLPAANYSIFPGLKGNLSSALRYKNELYVATSEGVYYLAEVKNYTEVEVLIKKEPPVTSVVTTPNMEDIQQDPRSNRINIFSRILGRRAYKNEDSEADLPEEQPVAAEVKPVDQYTWKTISKLKSIDYIYKKVSGMNEKCRQLVSTPYGILAATNKGLYSINDHKATLVTPGRYINFISWHPVGSKYYVGSTDGYFSVNYMNGKWRTEVPDPEFYYPVYSIFQKDSRTLWLGTDDTAFRAVLGGRNEKMSYFNYKVSNDFPARYLLDLINDTVFILTESGVHYYKYSTDSLYKYSLGVSDYTNVFYPVSNHSFARVDNKWISLDSEQKVNERELALLKIFDDVVSITMETDNLWIIDGNNRLFGIDRKRFSRVAPAIDVFIKSISSGKGTKFALDDIKFEPGDNVINFDIIAPGYLKQNTTQYQYFIDKVMTDWSPWSERTNYDRTISKPGEYTLQVRAKDLWGNIGEPQSVDFIITAPFTRKPVFYVMLGLVLLSLIIIIIRLREKQLLNKNKLLEEKVQERTSEIEAQKQEITSSIEYASR